MAAWNSTSALLADAARAPARCQALVAAVEAVLWTADAGGAFVDEQPAWQSYTGQAWDECRGMGWLSAVFQDDRPAVEAALQSAQQTGRLRFALRVWHAESGAFREVAIHAVRTTPPQGQAAEWIGTLSEIHESSFRVIELHRLNSRLTRQLEAHELEIRRLFELSQDVLLSIGADGRVLAASPSFANVTGLPSAQAIGRHCTEFVDPGQAAQVEDQIAAALAGRKSADFETRVRHQDGSTRIVSWRSAGLPEEHRVYAIGRDVTRLKEAEARTIRTERLQAVGQFTGGVAHDFNNILAAVMGYLEVALRLSRDERMTRTITRAIEASRRGARLVGQLLSFARKQELSLEAVDLNQLVRDLQPLIEQATRSNVAVQLDLDPHLPKAMADPTQIEMVLLNLSINARDAMPQGGTITLRTWQHAITDQPATRIDGLPDGRYACVSVVDSGLGMDEATLAHCFEPFFTTKAQGRGTGLGLAQALGAVQHCGGSMRVQSRLGVGTQVDVALPLAKGSSAADAEAPPEDARVVMVVEDDPDVLHATACLLEALGLAPLPFSDANAAVGALANGRRVDVILADLNMPAMSGIDVLRRAYQLRPKVQGILMTGQMEPERIQAALPGTVVLKKPLQPEQLGAILRQGGGQTPQQS